MEDGRLIKITNFLPGTELQIKRPHFAAFFILSMDERPSASKIDLFFQFIRRERQQIL